MRKARRLLALGCAAMMLLGLLAGCAGGGTGGTSGGGTSTAASGGASTPADSGDGGGGSGGVTQIRYASYKIGVNVASEWELQIIDRFNRDYAGQYEIVVEEIPDEQGYLDKMKVLAASGDLPNLVDGKSGVLDAAVNAGLAIDIEERVRADTEWFNQVGGEEVLESQRFADGKVYSLPIQVMKFGYYYNKDMFADVGIEPATTWDGFIENCEKLKAGGYTPLAINVSWMGGALLTSYISSQSDAGKEMMNQANAQWTRFNNPEILGGVEYIVKLMQNYSTPNCLDDLSELQMSTFCQGQAAILPNGSWQIQGFYDENEALPGFPDKVGCAIFPESSCLRTFDQGYFITGKTDEEIEGAYAFLKAYTDAEAQRIGLEYGSSLPMGPDTEITADFAEKNPVLADMAEVLNGATVTGRNLDALMPVAVYKQWTLDLAAVAQGSMTPEELATDLEAIAQSNA